MKILTAVLTLLIAIAFVGSAMAVMSGKTFEYPGPTAGKVVFEGKTHAANAKLSCKDCHPNPFGLMAPHKEKMKAPMKDGKHVPGEFCGICHDGKEHNGKVVFGQEEPNCVKCHKKAEEKK